jgi:hypothetical protein
MLRFPYQVLPVAPARLASLGNWARIQRFLQALFGKVLPQRGHGAEVGPSPKTAPLRPFVQIRIRGFGKARRFRLALVDTGSVSTVFPSEVAPLIGVVLGGRQHTLHWRGQTYPIEFQTVELELEQAGTLWRWRAPVGFSSAPLAYPLLGLQGCLEFMDAKFLGADHLVELEIDRLFPGNVAGAQQGQS